MVREGTFREDLFYRLEVVRVDIPPLRERRDDIPLLINYFSEHFAVKYDRSPLQLSAGAFSLLMRYFFPGNVRQLRNLIERLVVLSDQGRVAEKDLPHEVRLYDPQQGVSTSSEDLEAFLSMQFRVARETFERKYLLARLAEHNNNITHTAEAIGIHRQSLQQKIKDLDLKRLLD
jgi:DNA-binding NtrC family response regulator